LPENAGHLVGNTGSVNLRALHLWKENFGRHLGSKRSICQVFNN